MKTKMEWYVEYKDIYIQIKKEVKDQTSKWVAYKKKTNRNWREIWVLADKMPECLNIYKAKAS